MAAWPAPQSRQPWRRVGRAPQAILPPSTMWARLLPPSSWARLPRHSANVLPPTGAAATALVANVLPCRCGCHDLGSRHTSPCRRDRQRPSLLVRLLNPPLLTSASPCCMLCPQGSTLPLPHSRLPTSPLRLLSSTQHCCGPVHPRHDPPDG
jgi:hypothetical protein